MPIAKPQKKKPTLRNLSLNGAFGKLTDILAFAILLFSTSIIIPANNPAIYFLSVRNLTMENLSLTSTLDSIRTQLAQLQSVMPTTPIIEITSEGSEILTRETRSPAREIPSITKEDASVTRQVRYPIPAKVVEIVAPQVGSFVAPQAILAPVIEQVKLLKKDGKLKKRSAGESFQFTIRVDLGSVDSNGHQGYTVAILPNEPAKEEALDSTPLAPSASLESASELASAKIETKPSPNPSSASEPPFILTGQTLTQ